MAKKKTKAARSASRSGPEEATASGSAAACTVGELDAAAVARQIGEIILGTIGVENVDHAAIVNEMRAILQPLPATEQVTGEANADSGWTYSRNRLIRKDFADRPFLRVFGRVMEILLNHRRRQTCTAGEVFRVFLVEIPDQLEENHRQNPPPGQQVDVTESTGRKTFNNRMRKMCEEELAEPTVTRDAGRDGNYVLTGNGQSMFDGWPDLADIPGLTYEGPATPEPRPRRRS